MYAVFGLGKSALSVIKHLNSCDELFYVINLGDVNTWYDQVSDYCPIERCISQDKMPETYSLYHTIILSPGIPSDLVLLKQARAKGIEIISEIEYAFQRSSVPVLAVTGTNGKTTVCEMLNEALKRAGKNVFLGGNIGIPYTDILKSNESYNYAVIEVSSFQLENIKSFSPLVSVITNITPTHMERYSSFEDYKKAKFNIFKFQENINLITGDSFDLGFEHIVSPIDFDFSKTMALGKHNETNFSIVYNLLGRLSLLEKIDFQKFINEFNPSPYRIEIKALVGKCRIVNDGKSTNIESTIAAIKSFEFNSGVLILGGKLRDKDFDFSALFGFHEKLKIYAFGEAKELIKTKLEKDFELKTFERLEDVFNDLSLEGVDLFLFSPCFPSFDHYKNYIERAQHFNKLVLDFTKD